MTLLNLYELRPTVASYTENYVNTGWGMYAEVRRSLTELSTFEDIVQAGRVADGDVGLWASDAFDIWGPVTPPSRFGQHHNTFLAAKRALYVLLQVGPPPFPARPPPTLPHLSSPPLPPLWQHAQLPVDVVVEDDLGATLNSYKVIYLADTHVTDAASAGLAAWVKAGGTLVATAGAGMFNELNATNKALTALLGVSPVAMHEPDSSLVEYIKQDLAWAAPLGSAAWIDNTTNATLSAPIVGARPYFKAAPSATVIATHADGSPAATSLATGKGQAIYFGWLPGFSYFLPAIPKRPADRGGTDAAFTHFAPTNFSADVRALLAAPAAGASTPLAVCSEPLVHARPVVDKTTGALVVPLVNWAGANLTNVSVTVAAHLLRAGLKASLASGQAVAQAAPGTFVVAQLEVADALILRP